VSKGEAAMRANSCDPQANNKQRQYVVLTHGIACSTLSPDRPDYPLRQGT
jgi:hypothetical protein